MHSKSVYQIITDRILEKLEQGIIPWKQPWNSQTGMPSNLLSKRQYQGINTFLLHCSDFDSPYWLTFKQVQDLKGKVRKGEHGTPVIFWKKIQKDQEEPEDETKEKKPSTVLRFYLVFNVEQVDGIEDHIPPAPSSPIRFVPLEKCQEVVRNMKNQPLLVHGSKTAFYNRQNDVISLPIQSSFISREEYYCTLFHELIHSTGHESRLNRLQAVVSKKQEQYSQEELIAEMGASFLCAHTGIGEHVFENSVAYFQGWIYALTDNARMIVPAAAQAQKAADYILGVPQTSIDPSEVTNDIAKPTLVS